MKKIIAITLCVLMAFGGLACSAEKIVQGLTEKAEELGDIGSQIGEQLGGIGSDIGENLGEIGESLGENLGEIGESLGENFGEIGETIGETIDEGFNVQIANPFVDYATLEEAAQAAGFTLKVPNVKEGSVPVIQVMDGVMIQFIFVDENGDPSLYIRKEAGDEDISGDYNEYPEITTETVGDRTVTVKGSDGKVSVAIWTANGYSYAVMSETPMEKDAMLALINDIA